MTDRNMSTMQPLESRDELGIEASALPRHVAIIMDGNGRWAKMRGLPRIEGHRSATGTVREVVTHCARLGIEALTLYSFSVENWRRPKEEVDGLMALYSQYLASERRLIMENNIRLVHLGRREGLYESVLREMDQTLGASRENTGMKLCLALNYGSRTEIVEAVRRIAARVAAGEAAPGEIDERMISEALWTAGLPDPDLLIRTAGEMRISNFLLWQISYAELFVTPVLWPDFGVGSLNEALRAFANRERRFGDVKPKSAAVVAPA